MPPRTPQVPGQQRGGQLVPRQRPGEPATRGLAGLVPRPRPGESARRVIPGELVPPQVPRRAEVTRTMGDLASVYDGRLTSASARLRAAIRTVTARELEAAGPGAELSALQRVSRIISGWISGVQYWAATEAAAFLRALVALARDLRAGLIAPFMPAPVAGTTAAGIPMPDLTALGVRAFERLAADGMPRAIEAAQAWWDRIAASEPHRAANGTIMDNAHADTRLSGRYYRVTEPTACDFCVMIAERGFVYATAGFPAHPHCQCEALPELQYSEWNDRMRRYTERRTAQAPAIRAGWQDWRPGGIS